MSDCFFFRKMLHLKLAEPYSSTISETPQNVKGTEVTGQGYLWERTSFSSFL